MTLSTDKKSEYVRWHDVQKALGLNSRDLAVFEGDRIRARRMIQSFTDGIEIPGGIDHTLIFHIGGEIGVERYYDGRLNQRIDRLRMSTVAPAGMLSGWRAATDVDVLHLYIDHTVLHTFAERDAGVDGARVEVRDRMGVDDPFIRALAPAIINEMNSGLPRSRLLLDSFDMIVAGHLLRAYSNFSDRKLSVLEAETQRNQGQLLAKARAFIADNVGEDFGLEAVASHVGMSPFHFSRVFKAKVGVTPHQYLIEQRLARARDLLQHSKDDIVDVAYACGFSSQAHLTSTFSKYLGITPGRYRKERRG